MSCILRVFGKSLDVEALLAQLELKPDRVWRKGQPRFEARPNSRTSNDSGVTFVASKSDMTDFNTQTEEACTFLETHLAEIRTMVEYPDIEGVVLDFGIELRDVLIQNDYLPPKLIQVAAQAGIGIQLSHYACSKENES